MVSLIDPLRLPVLVLNRLYQPVRITHARRAIGLLCRGAATVLSHEGGLFDLVGWARQPARPQVDDVIPLVTGVLRVPRIVHLNRYARLRVPSVRLSRRNLMLRDGFCCQYCARRRVQAELDIDHVQPRSRGGQDSWTNLVTACKPCNRRKGQRTPSEASMPLQTQPTKPRWSYLTQLLAGAPQRYKEWEPYLQAS